MADNNGFKKTATMPGNERKCPNCGGTLTYNPGAMKLFCSLCGKYKDITKGTNGNAKVESIAYNDIFNSNRAPLGDKCKLLSCDNCGAELIYDSAQVSGTCPFCGSTNIIPAASAGSITRPCGIIPFSINEKRARSSFREYLKKELIIPGIKKYALENLFPVYLPYFSFDSDTVSDYLIEIGYRNPDGGDIVYKPRNGSYKRPFAGITVFASSKTQNDLIKKIGDFSSSSIQPFDPDYMAGYYAERNSTSLKHGFEVAQDYITRELNRLIPEAALRKFGGDKYQNLKYKTAYTDVTYKYILAPVYLASFTYKGNKYDVAINGSTGKVACDPPSTLKFFISLMIILGLIATTALVAYLIFRSRFT